MLRYDQQLDVWVAMPSMNLARQAASACCLNGDVYVFCGIGSGQVLLNSIEKWGSTGPSRYASWNLLTPPSSVFWERYNPSVTALNDEEIIIMGGTTLLTKQPK